MVSIHFGKFFTRLNIARLLSLLLLGVVYLSYVLIGGVVFWKLEGEQVQNQIAVLKEKRSNLFQVYPCLNQQGLEELAEMIQSATKNGFSLKGNHTSGGFWKFTSSAVFAATVVTTIGYGNMSPSTMPGQIFCVVFAIFGIPLNMVVLNRVGKYMLAIERKFCNFIAKKTNYQKCVTVSIHFVFFLISSVLYFTVPMLLFKQYEGWTYAQAIYYCFITLSTIGFGDYVADYNPDKDYPDWYGCIMGVWIFFGLAWLALVINHSIDLLEGFNAYLKSGKISGDWKQHSEEEGVKELPETQKKEAEH
ncbi:potassium channel subfamily K member 17-like [Colossoma macropomum]|uniref:potassium channel subfamily K member 17-like n=1 Tax=Colossoma macropomum TaxID=42526 RepID=UPI001863F0DC|nr:potassium channel subfamily K member 17-like [Colossoma macropomum]